MIVAVEMVVIAMGMGTRMGMFNPQFSHNTSLKIKIYRSEVSVWL